MSVLPDILLLQPMSIFLIRDSFASVAGEMGGSIMIMSRAFNVHNQRWSMLNASLQIAVSFG